MKKYLLIASIILATTFSSQAQTQARLVSLNTSNQGSILRPYPNPATTVVNLEFQKGFDRGYSIQVYNFLGRKMYEQTNISERTTINLADFNRGVYIYQLYDRGNKLIEAGKFQVSK